MFQNLDFQFSACLRVLTCLLVVATVVIGSASAETGLGRHKQLYAVPTPGKVVIDGRLDDWDLSGQIEMFVISEGKDSQSARFAVMYDADAIYLSGVVRDTSPMMNRNDPKVNGNRGWDADSCQFRLTVDASGPYPIKASVFEFRNDKTKIDTRDDIKHLTLWYYTDREEPCLTMQMGMTYRMKSPEYAPHGVVPADQFSAKYVKADDGHGYTFEYRIPWSTLGAKNPPKAGDAIGGTVQFNWGRPDGLKTAGGSAWAYDLMSGPGFVFQNAGVWGKIILRTEGNVPKSLVEAGVPPEKPNPLRFSYELPADGQITLQLVDQDKFVRRILVTQGDRKKGPNVEAWDGMDDQGKPLPAGTYTVKGIIHEPIKSEFLFSVHNSGQPPYPTDDGKGGWGGDHGSPTGCSALPDGMLLSWEGAEYGWGIIKVDLAGRKQWGIKSTAVFIANDGRRFYTYDPHGFQAADGIKTFDVADGRPVNFGNGRPLLVAPAGGDKASDVVTGLTCAGGKIWVSFGKRNLIAVYDPATGELEKAVEIPSPGALAGRPDGALIAISAGQLTSIVDQKITSLNTTDIEAASGIAVASNGLIYVSNGGARQDVAILEESGKLLRRIGKAGGRPAIGAYDANGLYMPDGLAVDSKGRLWVAENADSPKRVSVWNTTSGSFEQEFFGGSSYFGYAYINPDIPNEIYCHNVLWRVDWEKNTTTPISTIWRQTSPDIMPEPGPAAYPAGFRSITASNGNQYGLGTTDGDRRTVLYRREGDIFKPFMASFAMNRKAKNWKSLGSETLDDPKAMPDGWYLWQDANDDQRVQLNELFRFKDKNLRLNIKAIAPDLTAWATGGNLLKPVKWLYNGQPIYDPAKLEKSFLAGTPHAVDTAFVNLWLGPEGSVFTYAPGQRPSLARWSVSGDMEWGFPSIVRWQQALGLPVIQPGRLHGMTGGLGVAGDITGNMSYFGVTHLFHTDGTYVAAIMRDGRRSGLGADIDQPEGQGGALVRLVTRPGASPRTLLLSGGQDGRVTEIHGLDSIKPLASTTFNLTPEDAKLAADAQAEYTASFAGTRRLTIAAGRDELDATPALSKDLDATRGFSARLARDVTNLYVSFEVATPSELINSIVDPQVLFKGGNCLDMQFATNPSADAKRQTPADGDVRLLVTRRIGPNGKTLTPLAVLYRPKVKDFTGQPVVLRSPTGSESFDSIEVISTVALEHRKTPEGFAAVVTIPLKLLGPTLGSATSIKCDLGYIFGNATGGQVAARAYLFNNSFSANVVNDVPNESRLEPFHWGEAATN